MNICYRTGCKRRQLRLTFFVFFAGLIVIAGVSAREITLDQALDMAVHQSARGGIIKGREEVAQQNYYARKINFRLPEVSINGELPAYVYDESYRFFGGSTSKSLYTTKDLDFNTFLELKQNLPVMGGTFTASANVNQLFRWYPNTSSPVDNQFFINERSRRGFFAFSLEQELFRPSAAKYELKNRESQAGIAELTRYEEQSTLMKEVIDAYLNTLQLQLKGELFGDKLRKAELQTEIDSLKQMDGIVSEEDYLLSASARLDAELEAFEIENQTVENKRDLAMLLDVDVTEDLDLSEPVIEGHFDDAGKERLIAAWERSIPIQKAKMQYDLELREAKYAASEHGIKGDIQAAFSLGRQTIETEDFISDTLGIRSMQRTDDISTEGWSIRLQVRYPIWDGGAGNAAVKAAEFEAEQARLEYEKEQKLARAEIVNLVSQLDVSYRRLGIIAKQVEIAQSNLDIAQNRFNDGEISELTFLESKVFLLETKDKYLEELKKYLTNRVELEGKFI
jgi:outer membrane protein TolC